MAPRAAFNPIGNKPWSKAEHARHNARWLKDAKATLASDTIERLLLHSIEKNPEHAEELREALKRDQAFKAELRAEIARAEGR